MTLTELFCLYNFHDSDVEIPFAINKNDIIITFYLAKHLQSKNFKIKNDKFITNKDYDLLITVKFLDCTNIKASEWEFDYSKGSKPKRLNEKNITIEQIDSEMFLYTCSMSNEDGVYLFFTRDTIKGSETTFLCAGVEIVEEKFVLENK